MFEFIYDILAKIGYTHPLHPTITHVPIGLVIAAFVFVLVAWFFQRTFLFQTARHCIILALISVLPAAALGYMDWQHNFGGALVLPIKMKLILAGLLFIFLFAASLFGTRAQTNVKGLIGVYALCLLIVIALGYFGGELVYGKKIPIAKIEGGLAKEGAAIFNKNCIQCHYTDRTDAKVGPGLKGLYKMENLPVSKRPVNDENIRKQMVTPFKMMPPFPDLTQEQMEALLTFLKGL
jgi:uncharacterized membrane protein